MTAFDVDGTDVLVIYGDIGQTAEVAFPTGSSTSMKVEGLSASTRIAGVRYLLLLSFPPSDNGFI